jgi:hypothetical protein
VRFEVVETNRMFAKLDLHMREVSLKMSSVSRQVIKSLLDAIDPDMVEVFENEIFTIVEHRPISVRHVQ